MKTIHIRFTLSALLSCCALILLFFAQAHAQLPPPQRIKAEMIVEFPKSGIVCLTQETLLEVLLRSMNGEKTKVDAMTVSEDNPDAPCTMLSARLKYKVLSVQYNNPDTPEMGIMEIVGQKSKSTQGGWAMTLGARIVSK
jgi:hypothetical protein